MEEREVRDFVYLARSTSPAKVNALSIKSPQMLRLQDEDPDLVLLRMFWKTDTWLEWLMPEHKRKLEALSRNLMIDRQDVIWVQCQEGGPGAPPWAALCLPQKILAAVIFQFRQRYPDLTGHQTPGQLLLDWHERGSQTTSNGVF